MQRANVRMIQRSNRDYLSRKALAELLRGHFDSDFSAHARVARPVYLAHSARTERPENFVRPEPFTCRVTHFGELLYIRFMRLTGFAQKVVLPDPLAAFAS